MAAWGARRTRLSASAAAAAALSAPEAAAAGSPSAAVFAFFLREGRPRAFGGAAALRAAAEDLTHAAPALGTPVLSVNSRWDAAAPDDDELTAATASAVSAAAAASKRRPHAVGIK